MKTQPAINKRFTKLGFDKMSYANSWAKAFMTRYNEDFDYTLYASADLTIKGWIVTLTAAKMEIHLPMDSHSIRIIEQNVRGLNNKIERIVKLIEAKIKLTNGEIMPFDLINSFDEKEKLNGVLL